MTVSRSLDAGGILLDTNYACQKKHSDTSLTTVPAYACQVAEKAQKANIISPVNTEFKPLQTVSRAEAYSIFMKSACVHPVTTGENWITEIIKKAIELKFTVRTAESFEPNRPLTIFEMYAIANQVKKYSDINKSCTTE